MGCGWGGCHCPINDNMSLSMLLSADNIAVKLNVHVQRDDCFSNLKKNVQRDKERMSDIISLIIY